ncbi:DUF4760 domain-containing protein [Zobellia galactanivorans]|uniref:DUF4760 domain-containing protein n=1 Tax=Zobellia galactanivorans (strain DSM 12802 / CCUG 47099 / CIP 106680 / NCIMB 13871 / Dsij) TaxID=63186 RepID=UPI0026E12F04|nr:DUF4760 domain-containing protein [Zobellia galactanivorans]MDO6810031.1 DUF4760 domain-containing protein [Zobellia galactanivorans]
MKNHFPVNFNINYIVLALSIILIGGFFVFYVWFYRCGIEFAMIDVMAYSTGSVAIFTLIYHSLGLSSSYSFHKENLKIRRNQYSFEVISKVHDSDMGKTLSVLKDLKAKQESNLEEKNIKDFLKYLDENPEDRTKLSILLNYFEHISLLVENRHVDELIIKSAFRTLFTSTYSLLKFYIDERQLVHRRSWIKFEHLAKKWSVE